MHERWLILAVLTIARTDMGFQFQSVAAASQHLIGRFDLSFAALGILIGLYLFPGVAVAIPGRLACTTLWRINRSSYQRPLCAISRHDSQVFVMSALICIALGVS